MIDDNEIPIGLFREFAYVIEDDTDPDDFEYQQALAENVDGIEDGGFVGDIFHGALSSAPRIDMYRSWIFPDMYPEERQPVLKNWPDEDLADFCGIYNRKDIP